MTYGCLYQYIRKFKGELILPPIEYVYIYDKSCLEFYLNNFAEKVKINSIKSIDFSMELLNAILDNTED